MRSQFSGRIRIDVCRLDKEGAQILTSSLGDAAEDRFDHLCCTAVGTRPSQAPKITPALECLAVTAIAATIALEISGPIPGTLIRRRQLASFSPDLVDLAANGLDLLIERYPVFVEASNHSHAFVAISLFDRLSRIAKREIRKVLINYCRLFPDL